MCLEITLNKLNEIIEQQSKRIKELEALEEENKKLKEALALLREKPEPTKFTKECRALRLKGATEEQWEYADKLGQACVYIEQLQAKLDARKEK